MKIQLHHRNKLHFKIYSNRHIQNVMTSCDKSGFSYSFSLQCHMIPTILISCSRNISNCYQCCVAYVETVIVFFRMFVEWKKQHLFEIKRFCNINLVTFYHFNASLMNTSTNIHEKKATFFHKLLKGSASPIITVNGDMLKKGEKTSPVFKNLQLSTFISAT